jgi:hypothetical protein
VYTFTLPHTCYMLHPPHSSQFALNNIWWGVQLLIMKFSSLPY